MAKNRTTQLERITSRVDVIKRKLIDEDLILTTPEEELLERLVIAIQEFLELVS